MFVDEVRQEREDLSNAKREQRAAWLYMKNAFIDHFRKEETPPAIVKCVAELTKESIHYYSVVIYQLFA